MIAASFDAVLDGLDLILTKGLHPCLECGSIKRTADLRSVPARGEDQWGQPSHRQEVISARYTCDDCGKVGIQMTAKAYRENESPWR